MIFGRPTNLWLGLVAASLSFVQIVTVTLRPDVDPIAVATVVGAAGLLLGAVIALIAGQPPTVNPGDTIKIQTPAGEPNESRIVA